MENELHPQVFEPNSIRHSSIRLSYDKCRYAPSNDLRHSFSKFDNCICVALENRGVASPVRHSLPVQDSGIWYGKMN